MEQIKKDKLCVFCLGCQLLEDETFKGVRNCKIFIPDRENWQEQMREAIKSVK